VSRRLRLDSQRGFSDWRGRHRRGEKGKVIGTGLTQEAANVKRRDFPQERHRRSEFGKLELMMSRRRETRGEGVELGKGGTRCPPKKKGLLSMVIDRRVTKCAVRKGAQGTTSIRLGGNR